MLLNSRNERRIVIICRLREANMKKSSLAESSVGARSFAGDPESCCVGRAWPGGAVAGGPVAHGRAVPKRGILKQA